MLLSKPQMNNSITLYKTMGQIENNLSTIQSLMYILRLPHTQPATLLRPQQAHQLNPKSSSGVRNQVLREVNSKDLYWRHIVALSFNNKSVTVNNESLIYSTQKVLLISRVVHYRLSNYKVPGKLHTSHQKIFRLVKRVEWFAAPAAGSQPEKARHQWCSSCCTAV